MIFSYQRLIKISVDLLSCPFCNSDALTSTKEFGNYEHVAIKCLACDSSGPITMGIDDAVTSWNKRSPQLK